jgi:hypothetical protein
MTIKLPERPRLVLAALNTNGHALRSVESKGHAFERGQRFLFKRLLHAPF